VEAQRLSRAGEWAAGLPCDRRALKYVQHTRQKSDLPLRKVVQKRCELIIRLRAKAPKAGCRARGGGLVGGVRSGKGAARSRCRS
jgi:hypothetical protein